MKYLKGFKSYMTRNIELLNSILETYYLDSNDLLCYYNIVNYQDFSKVIDSRIINTNSNVLVLKKNSNTIDITIRVWANGSIDLINGNKKTVKTYR